MAKFMATIDEMEGKNDFWLVLNQTGEGQTITIEGYSGESKKVIIPGSFEGIPVTAIGDAAFSYEKKMTAVILPEGITSIEDSAFSGCTELTSISLPKTLVNIEDNVFFGCSRLTEIIVDEQNPIFASDDGVLFDKNRTTLISYPGGKKGEYAIPDTIVEIGKEALDNCKELTCISFPQGLMGGDLGFLGCERLADIIVDGKNSMFSSIDGIFFDKEGKYLLRYPQGKDNTDYFVPDKTDCIFFNAFHGCKNLSNIIFPEGLRFILGGAFIRCEGLIAITLPESLQYIGKQAFKSCSHLETITLSRRTKNGCRAFEGFTGRLIYRD